jgi:hypothetical protein
MYTTYLIQCGLYGHFISSGSDDSLHCGNRYLHLLVNIHHYRSGTGSSSSTDPLLSSFEDSAKTRGTTEEKVQKFTFCSR